MLCDGSSILLLFRLTKAEPLLGIERCLHYLSEAGLWPSSMAGAIIEIGKGKFYGGAWVCAIKIIILITVMG